MLQRWTLPYTTLEDWTTDQPSANVCEYPSPYTEDTYEMRASGLNFVVNKCAVPNSETVGDVAKCAHRCSEVS